jgi:hypothetical protein
VQNAGWSTEVVPTAVVEHAVEGTGAFLVGKYLRARNRVLFFRRGLGMSRTRAAVNSFAASARSAGALIRRGQWRLAFWGTARGWLAGLLARG